MIIVIAKLRAKAGHAGDFVRLGEHIVKGTVQEEGCITFEMLQDPTDPESFTYYEKWRSRDDLELHFKEPHFLEFGKAIEPMLDGTVSIVLYEVSEEVVIQ